MIVDERGLFMATQPIALSGFQTNYFKYVTYNIGNTVQNLTIWTGDEENELK